MDLIVAYDISTADRAGQRRLARVAAVCERYGVRAQYSVFECRIDAILRQRMISELTDTIEPSLDSVHIYSLGSTVESARESLGRRGLDWSTPVVI